MTAKDSIAPVYFRYEEQDIKDINQLPSQCVGFIYLITNHTNGKFYVGRKSFFSSRKKKLTLKEKALVENKRKTYKIEKKESNWITYTGSCIPLNTDIKNGDVISKTILTLCYNKKQLAYYEIKAIVEANCLVRDDCYNANLLGKFFKKDLVN